MPLENPPQPHQGCDWMNRIHTLTIIYGQTLRQRFGSFCPFTISPIKINILSQLGPNDPDQDGTDSGGETNKKIIQVEITLPKCSSNVKGDPQTVTEKSKSMRKTHIRTVLALCKANRVWREACVHSQCCLDKLKVGK